MNEFTAIALCLLPIAFAHGWYTGKKQGISNYLGFIYSKRNKQDLTCMIFPDEDTVEFVDPLEYNKKVLEGIADALGKESS